MINARVIAADRQDGALACIVFRPLENYRFRPAIPTQRTVWPRWRTPPAVVGLYDTGGGEQFQLLGVSRRKFGAATL